MNTKLLLGGLAGGIAFFILGWLVYGMLLMNFMEANMSEAASSVSRGEEVDMLWLIIGNLAWGFLFAFIISWSGAASAAGGAKVGFITSLLTGLAFDGIMMGTTTMMTAKLVVVDVVVWSIMGAIVGALVGMVMGRETQPSVA